MKNINITPWVISALLAINGFFMRDIVMSTEESKTSVTELKAFVQDVKPALAGLLDMRVQLAILQTKVEGLTSELHAKKKQEGVP